MIEGICTQGKPDSNQRGCYDCRHCKAAVTWWCTSEDAIALRGTRIPGVKGCPHWKPVRVMSELPWWEQLLLRSIPIGWVEVECGESK